ncbi:MAG: translation initiation factor [Flavobacteriaceae bacterium]|nr:translation initiation factor [Flavobacteriaceae bacterium]
MDLRDQLKNLFPEHQESEEKQKSKPKADFWLQEAPLICKYEKRKGKPITIIEGYTGADSDFKKLTSKLKKEFSVGGSFKKESIIIQGDYRYQIMEVLSGLGFNVKRVGG